MLFIKCAKNLDRLKTTKEPTINYYVINQQSYQQLKHSTCWKENSVPTKEEMMLLKWKYNGGWKATGQEEVLDVDGNPEDQAVRDCSDW